MNVGESVSVSVSSSKTLADQWILNQLQKTIEQAHSHFHNYRFDQLAKTLYEFVWNDYCDWYLELSKCDLSSESTSDAEKQGTKHTLLFVLENMMRLLHPIMPYITEEIWQKISPMLGINGTTIMLQPYPSIDSQKINTDANLAIEWIQKIVTMIRNIRGEMHVSPAKKISVIFDKGNSHDKLCAEKYAHYVKTLAKIDAISWRSSNEKLPPSATAISDQLEIHIPLAGLIDRDAELVRIKKEMEKCEKTKAQTEGRLNNSTFVDKAPAEVVAEVRAQLENCRQTLEKLREHSARIEKLLTITN